MVKKLKQALNSEGKNSLEPFSKEFKVVLLYSIKTVVSHLKRRRLRISRIDGQTPKIENPDNLPEEHLRGTIFENVIFIF